jgi:hypothetical protein
VPLARPSIGWVAVLSPLVVGITPQPQTVTPPKSAITANRRRSRKTDPHARSVVADARCQR